MKYLKEFKIYESVGLASSSLIYVDIILEEFKVRFDKFLKTDEIKRESFRSIISEKDLFGVIQHSDWYKMPISSMNVEFIFDRMSNDKFKSLYGEDKNHTTLGNCYPISDKPDRLSFISKEIAGVQSIHLKIDVGVILNEEFKDYDLLIVEIESTLLHELNHSYENIKRKENNKGGISVDLTYAFDVNRSKIKKEIWDIWSSGMGYYLYFSESHEVNAAVQEAWSYVKRYEFDEMIKKCPSWINADEMVKFKSSVFLENLTNKINSIYDGEFDPTILINRLKNGLANEMINIQEDYDQEDSTKTDKPSIVGKKIKNMSIDKFLNYIEKRINLSGQKIKKKILKLYSLK